MTDEQKIIPCQYISRKTGKMCNKPANNITFFCDICILRKKKSTNFYVGEEKTKVVPLIGVENWHPNFIMPSTGFVLDFNRKLVIGVLDNSRIRELTNDEIIDAEIDYGLSYEYKSNKPE